MKELSSVSNPIVKAAAELKQKKYRTEQQAFLVEGMRSVEEAVNCGIVKQLFVLKGTKTASARQAAIIAAAAAEGVELYEVTEPVMKKIADTETPQALTAIVASCLPLEAYANFVRQHVGSVARQSAALEELAAAGGIVLVLDRIGDPGNLGTMIRTADAAGISGVVLLAGCTDIFAPKAVRSTMGSLLHIPVAEGICEADFISWARKNGYEITVTCLENADSLYQTDLQGPVAVVVGSEAEGVSDGLLEAAVKKVFIPMEGQAESLNAAVAAGIVMFECLRQRLAGKGKL